MCFNGNCLRDRETRCSHLPPDRKWMCWRVFDVWPPSVFLLYRFMGNKKLLWPPSRIFRPAMWTCFFCPGELCSTSLARKKTINLRHPNMICRCLSPKPLIPLP
jgi:hypothetical protein